MMSVEGYKSVKKQLHEMERAVAFIPARITRVCKQLENCIWGEISNEEEMALFEQLDFYLSQFYQVANEEVAKLEVYRNVLEARITPRMEERVAETRAWFVAKEDEDIPEEELIHQLTGKINTNVTKHRRYRS